MSILNDAELQRLAYALADGTQGGYVAAHAQLTRGLQDIFQTRLRRTSRDFGGYLQQCGRVAAGKEPAKTEPVALTNAELQEAVRQATAAHHATKSPYLDALIVKLVAEQVRRCK